MCAEQPGSPKRVARQPALHLPWLARERQPGVRGVEEPPALHVEGVHLVGNFHLHAAREHAHGRCEGESQNAAEQSRQGAHERRGAALRDCAERRAAQAQADGSEGELEHARRDGEDLFAPKLEGECADAHRPVARHVGDVLEQRDYHAEKEKEGRRAGTAEGGGGPECVRGTRLPEVEHSGRRVREEPPVDQRAADGGDADPGHQREPLKPQRRQGVGGAQHSRAEKRRAERHRGQLRGCGEADPEAED
mmetsp:Transcript_33047/g.82173  ORF Transcript_33047/g.82173 Transcript_33047/m.82173 type:complete len:250 (+) Transcript_33047:192-941(+)